MNLINNRIFQVKKEREFGEIMKRQGMLPQWVAGLCLVGMASLFSATAQEYSPGIKLNGLTIEPYVNLEAIYDSNIVYLRDGAGDWIWRANPGANFYFKGNEWGVLGNVWYSYSRYQKYDVKDEHRFGESLSIYRESPKGWKILVRESYTESDQNDSQWLDGDGIWRNRCYFDVNGLLTYAFNERLSAGLSVMFADMWYAHKTEKYQVLNGWKSWSVGGEVSYALSPRSRALLTGAYQEFYTGSKGLSIGNTSRNYTLQGGFMSGLTERIRYRALLGASLYDYAGDTSIAPSYMLDASWKISNKLAATIAGAGYYQPSERSYYQQKMIYTISGGLTYKPMQRVTLTGDLIYRGEDNQTVDAYATHLADYTRNQYTARARAAYALHRYASIYASAEYTLQESNRSYWDEWDRYRLCVGLSLRY